MKEQKRYTGYISKSTGKNGWYEILTEKVFDGVRKVKLKTALKYPPVEFWVREDELCKLPEPFRTKNSTLRKCWECGCEFTYWECIYNGGDWREGYCGC
jgi:hypothetical protein